MKVTKQETLYHEDYGTTLKHNIGDSLYEELGATLKHKCGKRIVAWSLLSFSLIFCFDFLRPFFFFGLSFFFFLAFLWGGLCSNNYDHHTFIYLQLMNFNSKLEQDMTLYECLRRCTGICNESRATWTKIMKVALPQIQCQLHDHAKSNMTMMGCVIINGTVESCMAIYLGMDMEMP